MSDALLDSPKHFSGAPVVSPFEVWAQRISRKKSFWPESGMVTRSRLAQAVELHRATRRDIRLQLAAGERQRVRLILPDGDQQIGGALQDVAR